MKFLHPEARAAITEIERNLKIMGKGENNSRYLDMGLWRKLLIGRTLNPPILPHSRSCSSLHRARGRNKEAHRSDDFKRNVVPMVPEKKR